MSDSGPSDPGSNGRQIAGGELDRLADDTTPTAAWRLLCHSLDAGQSLALPLCNPPCQIVALDAALIVHAQAGRQPLLRMQPRAIEPGETRIEASEPTRLLCLQHAFSVQAELIARPLQGPMLLPYRRQTHWLVWLLAGQAHWQRGEVRQAIASDHPAWLDAEHEQRLRIDGGGEIILVKVGAPAGASESLELLA